MNLTTKTAQEFKKANDEYDITTDEKNLSFINGKLYSIISFKNELKENIDTAQIPVIGEVKIKCECLFCAYVRKIIQEIESDKKNEIKKYH